MQIARVIGTVVATVKNKSLEGRKFLIVQTLDADLKAKGNPMVALDAVGAGEEFLVCSPKQLQTILFEKLNLPIVKKTKTGYSTDESVLEQLAGHHELPAKVLAWRKLSKLKSTYIDALPPLVDPRTGRIHPRGLRRCWARSG